MPQRRPPENPHHSHSIYFYPINYTQYISISSRELSLLFVQRCLIKLFYFISQPYSYIMLYIYLLLHRSIIMRVLLDPEYLINLPQLPLNNLFTILDTQLLWAEINLSQFLIHIFEHLRRYFTVLFFSFAPEISKIGDIQYHTI